VETKLEFGDHVLNRMAMLRNQIRLFRSQVLLYIPKMLLHSYKLDEKVSICGNLANTNLINKKYNIIHNFDLLKSIDKIIIVLSDSLNFMISVLVHLLDVKLLEFIGVKHVCHVLNACVCHFFQLF
jgi:hypothetical protein